MADEKIIFSMVGVSKTFTNQKKVLNNIYLSFFYGAKIGIIGLNGSGKSTLMKIIAGLDKNFQGEVVFSPGYTVGYLEQEPRLDDSKTVREVVEEGSAATVALLKEYEEINMKLCEPMDDEQMARLIERQGELYEQIDQVNGWELDINSRSLIGPDGEQYKLPRSEFRAMLHFCENPGKIQSRAELLKKMTGRELKPHDRTVDVTIRRIRKHFESTPDTPEIIATIHGEGYRFCGDLQE